MGRRDERGAVAIMVGAISLALVLIAGFAVDLGVQRVARRDMQSLADVVALDLVRELDGRPLSVLKPLMPALAEASQRRNADTIGRTPEMGVLLGKVDAAGAFVELTQAGAVPTAVQVTSSTSVGFAFVPGSGGANRRAVAQVSSSACYKLGSWVGRVRTANSVLLNPVFRQLAQQSGAFSNGGSVGALDYTALAGANVDLARLSTVLGLASMDQLATATVGLRRFYTAISALAAPSNTTTVNVLNTLATTASTTASVELAKLLRLEAGNGSVANAGASALDLVGGSLSLLNGTNVANLYLGATLPSLTSAGLAVQLTQGPHQYCGGPGSASTIGLPSDTQQVKARLGGQLNPTVIDFVPPAISGLLSNVTTASITAENYATFDLGVAGTSSTLTSIACGNPKGVDLDVSNGLATITVSTPLRAQVQAKLLNVADATISINARVSVVVTVSPSGVQSVSIRVPPQAYDTPYPTRSSGVSVAPATIESGASVDANASVLGGLLGASISLTSAQRQSILETVINAGLGALFSPTDPRSLSRTVINPLLALAGAQIGGSDVILDGTPPINCGSLRLVG